MYRFITRKQADNKSCKKSLSIGPQTADKSN